MAAHRYWRAIGIEAYGLAGLDITEFQLLAGSVRVDAPATLSSSIAPATGALANLQDDDTSTGATWTAEHLMMLVLSWDFGAGGAQDVTDIRIGSGADPKRFLLSAILQWSDDAASWVDSFTYAGIAWPGARTKTASVTAQSAQVLASSPLLYYKLDETTGTTYADASGNGRTGIGSGTITPQAGLIAGSAGSLLFGSTDAQVLTPDPYGASYTGPWTVRAIGRGPSTGFTLVERGRDGAGAGWSINMGIQPTNGIVGVAAVYGGAAYSAVSRPGAHTYGTVAEVVAQYIPGTGLRLFLNGDLMASASVPPGASLRDSTIGLTVAMGNGLAAVGTECDEVAWWNTVLTADQIRAMADAGKIARTRVRGRVVALPAFSVSSAMSIALPYGKTMIHPIERGRTDYVTGVLGQGIGRVRGTTKDKGTPNVPVSERVRLYREHDGLLIREVWSAKGTGAYSFDYVDELQTYTVLSYDHEKNFRAVVADGLTLANGGVELIA